MKLTPITPEERERRWARYARKVEAPPPPPVLNLGTVLDVGTTVFFIFRGRAYGVPPLPWRQGEAILAAKQEAASVGRLLTDQNTPTYYRALRRLQDLAWANTRPVGRLRRLAKRLGLHPNPFRAATDQQLVQLADFFLARRMTSAGLRLVESFERATS